MPPARSGRWSTKARLTAVVGVALVVLLGIGAWLVSPFWQLAGQFGSNPAKQPSRLYGASTLLEKGAPASLDALADELRALGYQEADAEPDDGLAPARFVATGDALVVHRRRFPAPGGVTGGDRLAVTVRNGRVAKLELRGREVAQAGLEPPLVATFYGPELQERRPVELDQIPEHLILSVLAAEDAKFLDHGGVSVLGILRAAWVNFRQKEVRQGGSTLTQQLVKNLYLTHERSLARKLREAILAIVLEARYEKRAILEAYLNEIYMGRSGSIQLLGVGAAAWAYFGKDPSQLTLPESALLAGMIQSPVRYSPLAHPEDATRRRNWVLGRLAELEWEDAATVEAAASQEVATDRQPLVARRAPYFADFVEEEARSRFALGDLDDAGYVLLSTLDTDDQDAAEEAVDWGVHALEDGWEKGNEVATPLQSALVSVDATTGGVLAYVGGRDYSESQFDRVSHAKRQAGSAFKPIVYAAAFQARQAHPATFLQDAPLTVRLASQTWSPENSDDRFRGWVTARTALEKSLNVPTARLAIQVGLPRIAELAGQMGVRAPLDPYPSLALGAMEVTPIEMASVYTTLAAGGVVRPVHGLTAVFDREGQAVGAKLLTPPQRVLDEGVVDQVTRVLQGVLRSGTAVTARTVHGIKDPLAGKTGTTNDRRDSWFGGYSPGRATLVWVGYDDNARTRLSGARAALPIWSRFVYNRRPAGGYPDFPRPEGVVEARIDPTTGGLATTECAEVTTEVFLDDFVPTALCPRHTGWGARPLDQPEAVERQREESRHPFRRWLEMLRDKRRGDEG